MSYILDALKQSDTKRKREPLPELQQPAAIVLPRRKRTRGRLGGPLILLLLIAVGAVGWWQWREQGLPGMTVPSQTPSPAPANPSNGTKPEAVARTLSDADLKGVHIRLEDPVPKPQPKATAPAAPTVASRDTAPKPAPAPAAGQTDGATQQSATTTDPYADIPFRRQLPVDVQRRLPDLRFTVHIYSKDPASRMVMVGDRMVHEGQRITPEVRLDKIIPRGVILTYQDYRFRMNSL